MRYKNGKKKDRNYEEGVGYVGRRKTETKESDNAQEPKCVILLRTGTILVIT